MILMTLFPRKEGEFVDDFTGRLGSWELTFLSLDLMKYWGTIQFPLLYLASNLLESLISYRLKNNFFLYYYGEYSVMDDGKIDLGGTWRGLLIFIMKNAQTDLTNISQCGCFDKVTVLQPGVIFQTLKVELVSYSPYRCSLIMHCPFFGFSRVYYLY